MNLSIHKSLALLSFLAVVLVIVPFAYANFSLEKEWVRQFGTSGSDQVRGIATDTSGSIYVAGQVVGTFPGQTSAGDTDAYIRAYDSNGNELWTRQFGTSVHDFANGVATDMSGNVYVVGHTFNALSDQVYLGQADAFIRAYNSNGTELWTRQFGTFGGEEANGVATNANGNIYLTGSTNNVLPGQSSAGSVDSYIRAYDSNGNELWTRQFGTSGSDQASGIATDISGNIYVGGTTKGTFPNQISSGDFDAFIRAYDSNGNELWTRQFGTSGNTSNDGVNVVATDVNGNIYAVGQAGGTLPGQTSAGSYDAFIRVYDSNGNELWTRQFGTSVDDFTEGVVADMSGNIHVTGRTFGTLPSQTSAGSYDAFIRAYDSNGTELWTRQFGTSGIELLVGVATNADDVYVGGSTTGTLPSQTSAGSYDAFLVKFSIPIDTDGDGVVDTNDNCPVNANTDQTDTDGDGQGDVCDLTPNGDTDGDGVDELVDNCPGVANPGQEDNDGDSIGNVCDPTPNGDQLSNLDPAQVWIGLKNSDDVGIKFDLLAEAYVDTSLVSSGTLDSVPGGSSGFNNASLHAINFGAFTPVDFPTGSTLSVKVYGRNACVGSGKNSGGARLWYNDFEANSRFGTTIAGNQTDRYLVANFGLSGNPGTGPKLKVDVAAGAKCSPYKLFGTWLITQ